MPIDGYPGVSIELNARKTRVPSVVLTCPGIPYLRCLCLHKSVQMMSMNSTIELWTAKSDTAMTERRRREVMVTQGGLLDCE